jgi:hypothetical protein
MVSALDIAIHGQDACCGMPTQNSTGKASAAEARICAVIASEGRALALTAAFQAACSAALSRAAATSEPSTQFSSR